jgi:hypothetical protein
MEYRPDIRPFFSLMKGRACPTRTVPCPYTSSIKIIIMLYYCMHAGAIAAKDSYTESSLPMHIIDLNCTGTEQSLMDCPRNTLVGIHTCGSREDASLRCQGLYSIIAPLIPISR